MKLGIIGFSRYVRRAYVPYLRTRSDIMLNAVCDILDLPDMSQLIAEAELNSNPEIFDDMQKMLASVELDAVIVSTPHTLHFEQVKTCLEAGLHVIVDKPLACYTEQAKTLVILAKSKKLQLAVGNNRRYERPYQYLKEALYQKRLGEIRLISYLFANSPWYEYSQTWRGNPALSGGGVLIDIGHLAADMIVWLLERPLKWVFASSSPLNDKQVEQTVVILAEFEPSILINLTVTYETPMPSVQEELSVFGTGGTIFTRRFRPKRSKEPPQIIEQSTSGEIHQVSFTEGPNSSKPLEDFLRGIEENSSIVSDGESNLLTVQFIDAAYRSIQEQKRINLS